MSKSYITTVSGQTIAKYKVKHQMRDYRAYMRSERAKARSLRKTKREAFAESRPESMTASAGSILGIVFLILFIINFFYSATGIESNFSFTSLLHAFESAPQIPLDWLRSFSQMQITSDWGIAFNWLRDFLNQYVMKLISVTLFLVTGIAQLFTYAVYFIGILFGGV